MRYLRGIAIGLLLVAAFYAQAFVERSGEITSMLRPVIYIGPYILGALGVILFRSNGDFRPWIVVAWVWAVLTIGVEFVVIRAQLRDNTSFLNFAYLGIAIFGWFLAVGLVFWGTLDRLHAGRRRDFHRGRVQRIAGYFFAVLLIIAAVFSGALFDRVPRDDVFKKFGVESDHIPVVCVLPYLAVALGLFTASGGRRHWFLVFLAFLLTAFALANGVTARMGMVGDIILTAAFWALRILLPLWFMIWAIDWIDVAAATSRAALASREMSEAPQCCGFKP